MLFDMLLMVTGFIFQPIEDHEIENDLKFWYTENPWALKRMIPEWGIWRTFKRNPLPSPFQKPQNWKPKEHKKKALALLTVPDLQEPVVESCLSPGKGNNNYIQEVE